MVNEHHLESYADRRQAGETHDEAMEWFEKMGIAAEGHALAAAYTERTGEVWSEPAAPALIGDERRDRHRWYAGGAAGTRWRFARSQMTKLDEDALGVVHRASDKVVGLLDRPAHDEAVQTRGLVLGYVQSGKTTNFTAVAAKAADAGFKLIVVLSGIHESLRRQTQRRLWDQLVHDPGAWWSGTIHSEFQAEANPPESLLSGKHQRGLLVVKKNVHPLGKVNEWLDLAGDGFRREACILVIDDEADQAGIDVAPQGVYTGVHEQLRRLLSWGFDGKSRVAYVGYTATPYANILTDTDAQGLYPGDFIVDLPRPDGYMGAERLFGNATEPGLAVIRPVADADEELPDTLGDAIDWFVLATAARRVLDGKWQNSSMLVHVSQLRNAQLALRGPIIGHLTGLEAAWRQGDAQDPLREVWEAESAKVSAADLNETAVTFHQLAEHVEELLERLLTQPECPDPNDELGHLTARSGVIVDNSLPEAQRIAYPSVDDCAVSAIVIGGNTLSRGLTLEGLVCSYFSRTARAYDTLMQMGRWFGFRKGYAHLTRIWMTPELRGWFADLTEVEAEIRADIANLEKQAGRTPRDYAIKVRTHPAMAITRAAAMRSAVTAQAHLGDKRLQMTRFRRHDKEWLDHNRVAAANLLVKARDAGNELHRSDTRAFIAEVPVELVTAFLSEFRTVARNQGLRPDLIETWIEREQQSGRLGLWTVGVIGAAGAATTSTFDGYGTFRDVVRTHLPEGVEEIGYIKALMGPGDHRQDTRHDPGLRADPSGGAARRGADEPPLLLLYPIAASSANPPEDRESLGAVAPVTGLAVVFPASEGEAVDYMTADLAPDDIEEPDDPEADPNHEAGDE